MDNEAKEKKTGIKGKAVCICMAVFLMALMQFGCAKSNENGSGGGDSGAVTEKSFEVDAPVKSLCGFAIGATPDSVKHLFQDPGESDLFIQGKLRTPFRYFNMAEVEFKSNPVTNDGWFLCSVELSTYGVEALQNWHEEDFIEEGQTLATMLEKKYGIKFSKTEEGRWVSWHWATPESDDCVQQSIFIETAPLELSFESEFYSPNVLQAMKEKQRKSSKLGADAGADQL